MAGSLWREAVERHGDMRVSAEPLDVGAVVRPAAEDAAHEIPDQVETAGLDVDRVRVEGREAGDVVEGGVRLHAGVTGSA